MLIFTLIRNKKKRYYFHNSTFEIFPLYYFEFSNKKVSSEFIEYILDNVANKIEIYYSLPTKLDYYVFKHPNIIEIEEEYAKEAAKFFNVELSRYKKGWAICTQEKDLERVKNFAYKFFAHPLLDLVIPAENFTISQIVEPLEHHIILPSVQDHTEILNFYNLTEEELNVIYQSYKRDFNREPNIIEIGTFSQYWSEHCRHKTISGKFVIDGVERCSNLLKETIFYATEKLNKKWCVSVFKDNSGIIQVDNQYCICVKVETHNHPSSIEPYSGAATGIGGVIRDIIATGKGAKPIANLDVFFVGPIEREVKDCFWQPILLLKNLVLGVRDYGNRMGIPTVAGAVYFDDAYIYNPLVYCGTIGILKKENIQKEVSPGMLIVLLGGRTGSDGLHGASFSSAKLSTEQFENAIRAVQLPNPIVEKKVEQAILRLTQEKIIKSITDCGAGGIAVATLEITKNYGFDISLDTIKVKYKALSDYELWLSESQERIIILIESKDLERLKEIVNEEGVEYSILGNVTNSPICHIFSKGEVIANFNKEVLDKHLPQRIFEINSYKLSLPSPVQLYQSSKTSLLKHYIKKILSNPNISSKESIIRQYDHEVGGRTVSKPIGIKISPSDGAVLKLFYGDKKGVAVAVGHKASLMYIDPYQASLQSVDEAVRGLICLGANPNKIALLDNFCWGDANDPDQLYKLYLSALACKDIALIYQTPFISGKDSFNNYFTLSDGKRFNIVPTLLITAVGFIRDIAIVPSQVIKSANSFVYFVGSNQFLLGGSIFYKQLGFISNFYPKLNPKDAILLYRTLHQLIKNNTISSIHDVSDGGLITTVVEMILDSKFSIRLDIKQDGLFNSKYSFSLEELLFSEPPSSFVVEVEEKNAKEFERSLDRFFYFRLGQTCADKSLIISYNNLHLKISKDELYRWYTKSLSNLF
jgi:phosphoribosylformylglycinamidine synthase II